MTNGLPAGMLYRMILLVLASCHSPSTDGPAAVDPDAPPGSPVEDTAWTLPATEAPPFDAAALGAGLDAAVVLLLSLDSAPAMAAYDEVMAYRDPACPYGSGYSTTYQGYADTWYAQCETPSESTFSGYAGLYTNTYYEGYRSVYLSAAATVLTEDGLTWSASGWWSHEESDYGDRRYVTEELQGVYAYDGPAAAGTWIEDGLQAAIVIEQETARNGSRHTISVDGQIAGLAGAVDTIDLAEVWFDSTEDCAEPTGAIALRTPEGDWFDVAFAGDGTPEGCDGCGIARWRGLETGEVCADFTPWGTP